MKNAGPFGPGGVVSARSRQSPSRGEQLKANRYATWEELHTGCPQHVASMWSHAGIDNPEARMPAMRRGRAVRSREPCHRPRMRATQYPPNIGYYRGAFLNTCGYWVARLRGPRQAQW